MAKLSPMEQDEARLKKKVRAQLAGHENAEGDPALRALRKRLRRAQRKRRIQASRALKGKGAGAEKTGG
ncbi:hypothetical protein YTPLAS18_12390 [Nitrospira sp.]|nr:hypothetical protein YTPLAS18_12390 [Nitrospira sp.]